MSNTEFTIVLCSWIGAIFLVGFLWYLFGGFAVEMDEDVSTVDVEKTSVLTNIGIEVAGLVGAGGNDELVPITGAFKKYYLVGYASNDFLFRFYIYKRKIVYSIENFANGKVLSNDFKIKKGWIDFAALGSQLTEDFDEVITSETTDYAGIITTADKQSESKELTNETLVEEMLSLAKKLSDNGDASDSIAVLTTLFRFAPEVVEEVAAKKED